jgi:hypothetical protein
MASIRTGAMRSVRLLASWCGKLTTIRGLIAPSRRIGRICGVVAMPEIEAGDLVLAEGLDGERSVAVAVGCSDEPAGEHKLEELEDSPTVYQYWGRRVDPEERVISVRFALVDHSGPFQLRGKTYPFPRSQLRRLVKGAGGELDA